MSTNPEEGTGSVGLVCKCTNMARSRCPRSDCSSTSFEAVALEPKRSNFSYLAIQCAECGAVVGVQEMENTAVQLRALAAKLGVPFED